MSAAKVKIAMTVTHIDGIEALTQEATRTFIGYGSNVRVATMRAAEHIANAKSKSLRKNNAREFTIQMRRIY